MAAKEGNQNGIGNSGGKGFNDRKLAAEVRTLTLKKIKALFEMPRVDMNTHDGELHDEILVKLAGSVLPRLNEVTGEDGAPVEVNNAGQAEVNAALLAFLSNGTKPAKPTGDARPAEPSGAVAPVPVQG